MRHPLSSGRRVVATAARSEPAPGSLNSWQHSRSERRNARPYFSRCSSVPNVAIVGPTSPVVTLISSVEVRRLEGLLFGGEGDDVPRRQAGATQLARQRDRAVARRRTAPAVGAHPVQQRVLGLFGDVLEDRVVGCRVAAVRPLRQRPRPASRARSARHCSMSGSVIAASYALRRQYRARADARRAVHVGEADPGCPGTCRAPARPCSCSTTS